MTTRYELGPCPACNADDSTVIATADDMRDELEQLWSFHTRRIRGNTPPDLLHDRVSFSQRPPLAIARCNACSLLFRNPRERADTLIELYRDEAPDADALHTLFDNQRASYAAQAARLTRFSGEPGHGLEVGSYVGAFLSIARDYHWTFTGVDVNPTANAFARALGLDVTSGTIDDVPDSRRFDAIAFWNCFDQLPDPRAAARAAHSRLRAGGTLALRVPNGGFYAAWRTRLRSPLRPLARALLAHNNLLAFPYRYGFNLHALQRLLHSTGFRIERVYGDVLVPIADRWTRPWAAAEERLIKSSLRALPARRSPWLEVYARRT